MDESESDPDVKSREQRLDRNLIELLNELRVTGTGIQVLLAFLLVVPFNTGYRHTSQFDRTVYYISLIAIAGAAVLLIAPSVHHRLLFHHHERPYIIGMANTMAIAGITLLAIGMVAILTLISNFVFGTTVAIVAAILAATVVAGLWFVIPLRRRFKEPHRDAPAGGPAPRNR